MNFGKPVRTGCLEGRTCKQDAHAVGSPGVIGQGYEALHHFRCQAACLGAVRRKAVIQQIHAANLAQWRPNVDWMGSTARAVA